MRIGIFAVVLGSLAVVAGCGSSEDAATKQVCATGDTRACVGPGQCAGAQSCLSDHSGYGACDCGGGTGGAGGQVGDGGGAAGTTGGCPTNLPGPPMVQVSAPNGTKYCIDSLETTEADYLKFLDSNPDPTIQTAANNYCFDNKSFDVDPTCLPALGTHPQWPIRCVGWCDAFTYCAWAGKRLCGKVGGGIADDKLLADPNESEWYNACSKGGTLKYPYGNAYESVCDHPGTDKYVNVGSLPGCVGGFPGLHEMSGNVAEWDGTCAMPTNFACQARGGSGFMPGACDANAGSISLYLGPDTALVRIRCCHD